MNGLAPIMAEGRARRHVWVIDWYNFIVQHNPTPQGFKTGKGAAYENDLRDKVAWTHLPHCERSAIRKSAVSQPRKHFRWPMRLRNNWLPRLRSDNMFWRLHAQRLLVERGKLDVLPALFTLARDPKVDEIGLNVGAIHRVVDDEWARCGAEGVESGSDCGGRRRVSSPSVGRCAAECPVQVLPMNEAAVDAIALRPICCVIRMLKLRLMTMLALADRPADRTRPAKRSPTR